MDVLIVRRPGSPSVDPLLDDLALGLVTPARVFIAHDGPAAGPVLPHTGTLVSAAPAGTGWCRTELVKHSTADRLLVLDADMRCAPGLLRALLEVDDDIAHCPVIDPAEGLVGALPMEARRLAALPYLGAGYLVRRRVLDDLGGWDCDPWTEGLTDHLFWSAAAAVCTATLVQRPLLSRTWTPPPRRPLDLDPMRARQAASRPRAAAPVPTAGTAGPLHRREPRVGRPIREPAGQYAEKR